MSKTTTIELSYEFIESVASASLSAPMWIDEVEAVGEHQGVYLSEHIANGGTIRIHDCEEDEWHTVTSKQFVAAIGKYIQMLFVDESLSDCYLDDATAEIVFQLAVFGELTYA